MISQSTIDNNDLDKKYIDSLIALFKSRNNLKYPIDSPESKIIETLPIFDRNQINNFSSKIKSKKDVKDALQSIGFQNNYKYNPVLLKEILKYPPEIAIIIVYYQVLDRVYFQDKLETDDFALLIQTLNSLIPKANKEFINMSFYILYLKAQSSHTSWSENCIQQVMLFFQNNNSLTSQFYNILVHYLTIFIHPNEDKQTIRILEMLKHIFKSNYPIIHVPDLSKIVDLIHPFLFAFNYHSLLVFAYMSKIDKKSTESDIRIFPEFFTTLALKNADAQNMSIKVNEQKRIHDLPAVYSGHIPDFEYKIQDIDTFHNTFYPIPNELYKKNNQLGNLIPENTKTIIRNVLREFFEILDPKLIKIFFQEMNKALQKLIKPNDYNGFAAYLFLLHYSITSNTKATALSKQYLDENIPYFFPKPKLTQKSSKANNEISFGEMFYNPENTIYGPIALDPVINSFRTAILFLTTSTNLYKFIESMKGCPFLMAEQISRLSLRFDTEVFSSFNKNSEQIFRTVSREMAVLQMKNAQSQPRNAFFLFFIHFLTSEKKVGDCFKSTVFVDSIFRYIFETGVMDQLILVITKGFLLLNDKTYNRVNVEPAIAFLFNAATRNKEIAPKIYQMVANILKFRPFFINKFNRFLDLMINELQEKQTKEAFDNVIILIELMANSQSHEFFGPKNFGIIARNVKFASYQKLFNLMAGGYNFDTKAVFLIRQPIFIPLLIIAYANDYKMINSIIELFYMLATRSELNCIALHDGDLDMILLKYLNKENPLKYKGVIIPQLEIDDKVATTTVPHLLYLIISSKSNFSIAKKMIEIIIKGQNLSISKLTNSILASYESLPNPSFPIGSLSHFCSVTGLTDKLFKGDISFTFWIKTDPAPLSHTTSIVNLISIIDKNEFSFNIILQNNLLLASYETKKKKTSVCLCQRLNSNTWTHFAITFSNTHDQKPLISTFKNFERLHDSEFCYVEFAPGPLEIRFGGSSYDDRAHIYPDMQYGSLSRILIFNRYISTNEIILILQDSLKMPDDYIVSTLPSSFDNNDDFIKYKNIQITEKNATLNYIMNDYTIETLKDCFSNEQVIDGFIESLRKIQSRPLIDQIFDILDKIISFTTNKTISSRLASILLNSDYPDFRLYKTLEQITSKIKDKDTQKCWIEDLLINIPIWNRSDTFKAVINDYSKLLINYPQFFKKSYFYYFLNQFNIFVNSDREKRDEVALKEFTLFIERYPLSREKNETNIEKEAVNNLICYATNAADEDKVIYLEIIEKMADSINQVNFTEYEYIFHFVAMNNINISLHAIIALHQILTKSFHAIIYSIIDALTISLNELFTRLEPYVKRYPNLFSLTCAIGLKIGKSPSQFPYNITLSHCWFVFPLLTAMAVPDNTPYIDLIARNAVKSNDINMIVVMTTYLNLFVEQNHMKNNNNILQSLLLALFRNHKAELNLDRKYQIFFHLFSASFFKINAPLMRNEIADLIDEKPEKPEQIQKIKVIDFDSFRQMVTNAEVFINDLEKQRNEIMTKYNEMKKKREMALVAQQLDPQLSNSQIDFKPDDEEFEHLESMIESVKTYKLRFSYTIDDINTLRAAFTLFNRHLNNYTIDGIQSESSGTIFKTRVPAFVSDDLKQLMDTFIAMYFNNTNTNNNNATSTNNLNDDNSRRLSLDSSSNQMNSALKSLNKENEEENIRLVKDDPNVLATNSNIKSSINQISPSSSSPLNSSSQSASLIASSSSPLISVTPIQSGNQAEQISGSVILHPITPYDKQLKIFDFFAENLNNYLSCGNFKKVLNTIRPQKEFLSKIAPINSETCSNLIKGEEERAKLQKIITERSIRLVRSHVIGYSMIPYLMKREKSVQPVSRFKPTTTVLTSPNAKLISFEDKSSIYFEVPFTAELNEQLIQQQKQEQQLQMQQQNLADKQRQQQQQNLTDKQKQQQQNLTDRQRQQSQQNLSDKQRQNSQQNLTYKGKQQQQQQQQSPQRQQNLTERTKQQQQQNLSYQQQQQQNLSYQQQQQQQRKPISQPPKLSNIVRLSSYASTNHPIFTNDRDYIIQSKNRRICIDKSKVISIFSIDNTTIELIDNRNQPYLIQFVNQEETIRIIKKITIDKRCKFALKEDFSKNIQICIGKSDYWFKGYISTFHYLSILNFFGGRNYENASRYPLFPSLTPYNKITDNSIPSLNRTFFLKKGKQNLNQNQQLNDLQFDNRLFVLPELYYLFESDDIENVYKRRKLLEEVSKTDKKGSDSRLLWWIDRVFGTNEFNNKLFKFSHVQRQIDRKKIHLQQIFLEMETESKIIYAAPFYRESSFCIVLSTGECRFIALQITDNNNNKGKNNENVITDIDVEITNITTFAKSKYQLDPNEIPSLKFAPLNVGFIPDITALLNRYIKYGFVAYNKNRIHFVDLNGRVTKENIYLENPIFHNAVVLSTPSTISLISSFLGLQIQTQNKGVTNTKIDDDDKNFVLYRNHAKVTCLQSSVIFGIIAIGSDDCKLRIRALNDGKKIATINLDDTEVPTVILITESWGFIVVYCVTKLYVFSVNGKLIKKCDDFVSFSQWFTFKSADDFDYVAVFNDRECKMLYFEVMYPDEMKEVELDGKIVTMRYEPKFNCFIFLADNGKITLISADI